MATAIKDIDLSAVSVRYGGVQFGGAGGAVIPDLNSAVRCTPPSFGISWETRYDDADRVVVALRGTLTVNCFIYSDTIALQEGQLGYIRKALQTPRGELLMQNVGLGFTAGSIDTAWGPKPRSLQIEPIGLQAARLSWRVDFEVAPCDLTPGQINEFSSTFKAFNYSQSWTIDLEGLTTRTTSGYVEVAQNAITGQQRYVVDGVREFIVVEVPAGFERSNQSFTESPDKSRLTFAFTDTQLTGDAPPEGIIRGSGNWSMQAQGPVMSEAILTMQATLTVPVGAPPSLAALQFFLMAQNKIAAIRQANPQALILLLHIDISTGLMAASRTSSFRMVWTMTRCISEFLVGSFWHPVTGTDYAQWRQSIEYLWHPRGSAKLESQPDSDVLLNICDGVQSVSIEEPDPDGVHASDEFGEAFSCDNIDPRYSWLDYDVEIQFQRNEHTWFHRTASSLSRFAGGIGDGIYSTVGTVLPLGFESDATTQDVTEQNGQPEQLVLVKYKGARAHYKPTAPELQSIAGQAVEMVRERHQTKVAGVLGNCVIYSGAGWRLYKVKGYVNALSETPKNPTICEGDDDPPLEDEDL